MASIITHVVVPISIWVGFRSGLGHHSISNRLLIIACIASMLPDLDVIGFKYGVPYSSEFGHRGFTHSIGFSVFIGFFGLFFSTYLKSSKELMELGGWKSYEMVLRYAHLAPEHLAQAASRTERKWDTVTVESKVTI